MKICFVSHSAERDGAELALVEIVDALRTRGVECIVVLPTEGPLRMEFSNRGVELHTFRYGHWSSPGRSIWQCIKATMRTLVAATQLAQLLRNSRCDVVYSNTIVVPVGAFAAALVRLPHVWHIHEFGWLDHNLKFDWGDRLSLNLINRLSAVCFTNSAAVKEYFSHRIDSAKLRLVYNSMELSATCKRGDHLQTQTLTSSSHSFRCVLVGRIGENKGQEDAILALNELAKSGIHIELYLVGRGSPIYIAKLKEKITRNGLGEKVVFTGRLDDPTEVLESADVALMCSRQEAFGRVMVEGMLAGKAVIGARSGATPELIREGFNGLLYTPGNPHELATRIRYLYENHAEAVRMGSNGRRWAQSKFSEKRLAEDLVTTLNSVTRPVKMVEGGEA